jgi:hypothetical protein
MINYYYLFILPIKPETHERFYLVYVQETLRGRKPIPPVLVTANYG